MWSGGPKLRASFTGSADERMPGAEDSCAVVVVGVRQAMRRERAPRSREPRSLPVVRPLGIYPLGMSADRKTGRLRQAYEEAWAARLDSGTSDEVLRTRLRAHGLSEVLDETSAIHSFVFDLWRRDVPPHRIGREAWKATGHVARHLITTGRSLLETFRPAGEMESMAQADLHEMPEGKEGVLDNYDRPASATLTFEPAERAASLLSHYASLNSGRLAWERPPVWFDMLPEQPRARVLLGDMVIGEASVPIQIWRTMRDLAEEDLYADGFLDFRLREDQLETGALVCYYPAG